jgi:hypothetical protein
MKLFVPSPLHAVWNAHNHLGAELFDVQSRDRIRTFFCKYSQFRGKSFDSLGFKTILSI